MGPRECGKSAKGRSIEWNKSRKWQRGTFRSTGRQRKGDYQRDQPKHIIPADTEGTVDCGCPRLSHWSPHHEQRSLFKVKALFQFLFKVNAPLSAWICSRPCTFPTAHHKSDAHDGCWIAMKTHYTSHHTKKSLSLGWVSMGGFWELLAPVLSVSKSSIQNVTMYNIADKE